MQYCSNPTTKVPGLFATVTDDSYHRSNKLLGQLQMVCTQSKPAEMVSVVNPVSVQRTPLGSKKKSMPDQVLSSRNKTKSNPKESKSLTKHISIKRQSMDTTPQAKSPMHRLQSPHRPISMMHHSPLDFQETTNIKVYSRFRPLNKVEVEMTKNGLGSECSLFPDQFTVILQPDNQIHTFDQVFSPGTPQQIVYDQVGKDAIADVLNGYNGTIFAYGQTGSGKTYTMFGDLRDNKLKGIIPRSIESIFNYINESDQAYEFVLTCSMLEIYKETLFDLLAINRPDLKIKESLHRGIYVENLSQISLSNQEELLKIVELGEQTRKVAATRINQYSSRSHTIFMLEIKQKMPNDVEKKGKLNLVDLAGSEKVGKTGAMGEILEEAKKINLSLSCLGNVIHAITTGNDHIPYRNSKLTRILQESLGGNYKTSLIVTCSSHSSSLEETVSTLKFASRAKSIKNHFKMNVKISFEMMQQQLMELKLELQATRQENEKLKQRSLVEIPNEGVFPPSDVMRPYDTKILSNQEKRCFKKPSFQSTQNISETPENILNMLNTQDDKQTWSQQTNVLNVSEGHTPLSQIKSTINLSHQQSQSMELSFFSSKKPSQPSNEIKALTDQIQCHKDQELQYIRHIEELRTQLQQYKMDSQKKALKIQQYQSKVASLERINGISNKENSHSLCKQSATLLRSLQDSLKNFTVNSILEVQTALRQLEDKIQHYESTLTVQLEVNQMLRDENAYINKIIEVMSTQQDQDEYLQTLVREKTELINAEYFKKLDSILNNQITNSRVVKVVNRSKPQVEDVVRQLSKNKFIGVILRMLTKDLQDILKNLNPDLVKRALSQVSESLHSTTIEQEFVEYISQYEALKHHSDEGRLQLEALNLENNRMHDKIIMQEQQILQLQTKSENITQALILRNQQQRQRLNTSPQQPSKDSKQRPVQRSNLFRFDYGIE